MTSHLNFDENKSKSTTSLYGADKKTDIIFSTSPRFGKEKLLTRKEMEVSIVNIAKR